jgi:nicotinamide phosphoribosyltransferase
VLTEIVPSLREEILARQPEGYAPAKVVIRPDSGDPVKILTGDPSELLNYCPAYKGALQLLAEALGTTDGPGGKSINKGGLIYGDSITVDRADQILTKTRQQGFSPYNHVFGIGSYTYQYVTRDTYNFAFKATAIEREVDDEPNDNFDGLRTGRRIEAIFKEPVTAGDFSKKSARGIPAVYRGRVGQGDVAGKLYVEETLNPADLDRCEFRKVFNGELLIDEEFDTIRKRVRERDWV